MKGLNEMDFIQPCESGYKVNVQGPQIREEHNNTTSGTKLYCPFCCSSPCLLKDKNKDRETTSYAEHPIVVNITKNEILLPSP